jgi:hypothetical protein
MQLLNVGLLLGHDRHRGDGKFELGDLLGSNTTEFTQGNDEVLARISAGGGRRTDDVEVGRAHAKS